MPISSHLQYAVEWSSQIEQWLIYVKKHIQDDKEIHYLNPPQDQIRPYLQKPHAQSLNLLSRSKRSLA